MWDDFLAAIALVLVIEGLLPFAAPSKWQKTMQMMAEQETRFIRRMGLISMVIGVFILYWVRGV